MSLPFAAQVSREGIGNMKGAMADELPQGVVLLAGAEMDFATASCIREALADFARRGLYGFTLPDDAYLASVCGWMREVRAWEVLPEEVVPTMGTIHALCTTVRAFTEAGEGVVIQHPSYYRFDRAIERLGRRVVSNRMVEKDGVYALDLADLERCLADPANRLLVLCNPHNPTGRVFDAADLRAVAHMTERYDVTVFCDEIFAETAQPGHEVVPYASIDREHGITSTSLGKAFNFTGVNQANLVIPSGRLREAFLAQQDRDHFGSIDPFFYTALRAAYTPEGAAWVSALNANTAQNYELLKGAIAGTGLGVSPLEGSFVAWVDCRSLGLADDALADFWAKKALVAVDPGSDYGLGGSGFCRVNLGTTRAVMERAAASIAAALAERRS